MSRRRKIVLVAAVVLGVLVSITVHRHFQLKRAVEQYKAELKAKGEPMELAEVIPPRVPPESNLAGFFTNAISVLSTNGGVLSSNQPPVMRMVAFGKAMIGWSQPYIRDYPGSSSSNSWAEIDAALADDERGLNLLRQLPSRAVFDFGLDYEAGFNKMKFGPLAPAKMAVLQLSTSCSASLHRQDTKTASRDIQAIFSIAHSFSHDRILISELVRAALLQIAFANTWEFLQSANLTDQQLSALQADLDTLEVFGPAEHAILLERVVGATDLQIMRSNGLAVYFDGWREMGTVEPETGWLAELKVRYKTFMWRHWWSYADELRSQRGLQAVVEAVRNIEKTGAYSVANSEMESQIFRLKIEPDNFWFEDPAKADFRYILSSSVSTFARILNKAVKVDAARQMTITAIALKRFQLKHGVYPEKLAELTPEFLPSVPLDPIDGQPLRYRRNADGSFTLYSIGENNRDDGGNPALADDSKSKSLQWQNSNALDWVWPQPATEAEIQKYYEAQAQKL